MGKVNTIYNFKNLAYNRYPRNIAVHLKGFKAEELGTFLVRYLLPLVYKRVSDKTYQALQRLVFSISKATGLELAHNEIDEIEYQMNEFLRWFYATFYRGNNANLSACKYTVHALSHLAQNLRDWGPASYYWQYTEVLHDFFQVKLIIAGTVMWYPRWKRQKSCSWFCKPVYSHASTPAHLLCNEIWLFRESAPDSAKPHSDI
jgi:hypothetical protein